MKKLNKIDNSYKDIEIPVAMFPHVSGNAQRIWMEHADLFSELVQPPRNVPVRKLVFTDRYMSLSP